METKQLSKSAFSQMLKQAGNENLQTIFNKDTWYEQVTLGESIYQHKLLSLKKTSAELLTRKALEAKPSVEPIRLRAQNGGCVPVVAGFHRFDWLGLGRFLHPLKQRTPPSHRQYLPQRGVSEGAPNH